MPIMAKTLMPHPHPHPNSTLDSEQSNGLRFSIASAIRRKSSFLLGLSTGSKKTSKDENHQPQPVDPEKNEQAVRYHTRDRRTDCYTPYCASWNAGRAANRYKGQVFWTVSGGRSKPVYHDMHPEEVDQPQLATTTLLASHDNEDTPINPPYSQSTPKTKSLIQSLRGRRKGTLQGLVAHHTHAREPMATADRESPNGNMEKPAPLLELPSACVFSAERCSTFSLGVQKAVQDTVDENFSLHEPVSDTDLPSTPVKQPETHNRALSTPGIGLAKDTDGPVPDIVEDGNITVDDMTEVYASSDWKPENGCKCTCHPTSQDHSEARGSIRTDDAQKWIDNSFEQQLTTELGMTWVLKELDKKLKLQDNKIEAYQVTLDVRDEEIRELKSKIEVLTDALDIFCTNINDKAYVFEQLFQAGYNRELLNSLGFQRFTPDHEPYPCLASIPSPDSSITTLTPTEHSEGRQGDDDDDGGDDDNDDNNTLGAEECAPIQMPVEYFSGKNIWEKRCLSSLLSLLERHRLRGTDEMMDEADELDETDLIVSHPRGQSLRDELLQMGETIDSDLETDGDTIHESVSSY